MIDSRLPTELELALGELRACEREVEKLEDLAEQLAGDIGLCLGCDRVVALEGCICPKETLQ